MGNDNEISMGTLTVEHRLDIHDVLNLYAHLVDAKSWDQIDHVFTVDAAYDMTTVGLAVYEGLPTIRAQLASMNHPEAHFALGPVMGELDGGGSVPVRSKYVVRLKDRTVMDGLYEDRFILTPEGWRIRSRRILRTGAECRL